MGAHLLILSVSIPSVLLFLFLMKVIMAADSSLGGTPVGPFHVILAKL